ncbi:hypothetical protein ARAF_0689 [Arsenophonus endosymbiont of Aleurodicus floccissimus]|nr:hypothetical protein ARAF_0689 [Arsenophonus endosymbiont of Aleurodicus floccissimus]
MSSICHYMTLLMEMKADIYFKINILTLDEGTFNQLVTGSNLVRSTHHQYCFINDDLCLTLTKLRKPFCNH